MGDQIDPVPGAIELALHGLAAGGEIAIRSHKDLRGDLPDEFQVKVLEIMDTDNLKQAEESKNLGNKCYKSADYEKAVRYYERGIGYINEYQSGNEKSPLQLQASQTILENMIETDNFRKWYIWRSKRPLDQNFKKLGSFIFQTGKKWPKFGQVWWNSEFITKRFRCFITES